MRAFLAAIVLMSICYAGSASATTCAAYGKSSNLMQGAKLLDRQSGDEVVLTLANGDFVEIVVSEGIASFDFFRKPTPKEIKSSKVQFQEDISKVPVANIETRYEGKFTRSSIQLLDYSVACER